MAGKKRRKLQERGEAQAAEESRLRPGGSPREGMLVRLIAIGLVMLTFAAYWRVLGNGFINMDDDEYVTSNIHVVDGITGSAVAWALKAVHSSNWHPLTWISHMLDCQLYCLNPLGHHLTGLLFHILNVLLLFILFSRMTGYVWRSAFVAALFAIHPLHVESVVWVAERKDVLSTTFWLLTMLAYYWYTLKPELKRYVLVAVLFALGLMAKPMLVSLPIVLLLMDYWPLGRARAYDFATLLRMIREKLPLFALAAASCLITFLAQSKGGAVGSLERFPFSLRVENALVSYAAYLGKMLWPHKLAVLYPFPASVSAIAVLGAVIALILITVVAVRNRASRPYLAAGWLWYLVTLIPVIGIVQVGNQAMADRYTYVPLIGVFIAIAWGVPELLSRSSAGKRLTSVLAFLAAAALAFLTYVQVGHWKSSITLFRHTLAATSHTNYIAHGSLAAGLLAEGKTEAAMKEARITVSLAPNAARPHDKLGAMLAAQGNIREGMEECKRALELDPKLSDAHYNLGAMLHKLGDIEGAIREYEETLRLKPDDPDARKMLELARSHGGGGGSIPDLLAAVQKNPNDHQAHYRLAMAYDNSGKQPDKALQEYRRAISLKPDFAPAHNSLGMLLGKLSRLDEAVAELRESLRLEPKSADTLCNLAVALSMQGKPDEAMAALLKAVQITPENAGAHGNLAILYYGKQDYAAAWREVDLCRKYGGTPNEGFLRNLAAKMSEP